MKTLAELGEDGVIEALTGRLGTNDSVVTGPGDDCAVVTTADGAVQFLKTDTVISGVHFLPDEDGERVGWKAVARVVSDVAAMGGRTDHLVVALAVGRGVSVEWLEAVYIGMDRCAGRYGAAIVGGETSSLGDEGAVVLTISGTGHSPDGRWVSRGGARPGDSVYVTGRLGGSLAGKHLDFSPRVEEGVWLGRCEMVTAMMDLSDGLAKDLPRMARMSGCGFMVDPESLPLSSGCSVAAGVGDGEDYELLLAVRGTLDGWPFPLEMTCVGAFTEAGECGVVGAGWDHFPA